MRRAEETKKTPPGGATYHRELEILSFLVKGSSNTEIAHRLFISEKTVKNHLTSIFRKLGVADRTQAVVYAIKERLVEF
ncbi:MAG: response regulator transcription factor [Clostridia bacterium]|nr:response regulator transcription factor [Clostridia bacterium]